MSEKRPRGICLPYADKSVLLIETGESAQEIQEFASTLFGDGRCYVNENGQCGPKVQHDALMTQSGFYIVFDPKKRDGTVLTTGKLYPQGGKKHKNGMVVMGSFHAARTLAKRKGSGENGFSIYLGEQFGFYIDDRERSDLVELLRTVGLNTIRKNRCERPRLEAFIERYSLAGTPA